MQEFLTATILSGVVYDIFKHSLSLRKDQIKQKLIDWVIDDQSAEYIVDKLNQLQLSEDLSESAIEKKINSSTELVTHIANITKNTSYKIQQIHLGNGDNVAGNKYSS